MKNDTKKRRSKRRGLLTTGIASLALLATIATATYAWFSINTTVTVGVSSLEAVAGDNIDISSDGSNWGSSVSLTLDELNSTVTDISGNGKTFFNKAGQESTDFVEFKLQFRASSYYAIYLNSNSSVLPNATDLVNGNKSSYGNYSKDYIAGAVRVAFLYKADGETEETVRLVWAPNSNYALTENNGTFTLNNNDTTRSVQYSYRTGSSESDLDYFLPDSENFLVTNSTSHLASQVTMYNNKNPLATIIPETAGAMKEVEITVRIWLEGTDDECKNPFLGGIFNTTLSFSADALVQDTRPTVQVNSVGSPLITGYSLNITGDGNPSAKYEISTDGKTYTAYNSGDTLSFVNKEVYVRESADTTSNGIPGAYTRVTIGKKGQAAPDDRTFTAEPNTRILSANSYAPNGNGAGLEYSVDNVKFTPFITGVNVGNNAKRTYYVRYAAYGDFDASESVEVPMLGKETKPLAAAVSVAQGQGSVTINAGLEYVMASAFAETPTMGEVSNGDPVEFVDQCIIAVRKPGTASESVNSDWAYFKLDNAAGTVTAVTGPAA